MRVAGERYFAPPTSGFGCGAAVLKFQERLPDAINASRATRMNIPET